LEPQRGWSKFRYSGYWLLPRCDVRCDGEYHTSTGRRTAAAAAARGRRADAEAGGARAVSHRCTRHTIHHFLISNIKFVFVSKSNFMC